MVYLEAGQYDPADIHVTDEDISSNLPDMLEKREVQVWVLEPGQLQVALHKGAVCIPEKYKFS